MFLLSVSKFLLFLTHINTHEIPDLNISKLSTMTNVHSECCVMSSKNTQNDNADDKCLLQVLTMLLDFFI